MGENNDEYKYINKTYKYLMDFQGLVGYDDSNRKKERFHEICDL